MVVSLHQSTLKRWDLISQEHSNLLLVSGCTELYTHFCFDGPSQDLLPPPFFRWFKLSFLKSTFLCSFYSQDIYAHKVLSERGSPNTHTHLTRHFNTYTDTQLQFKVMDTIGARICTTRETIGRVLFHHRLERLFFISMINWWRKMKK